jgi:hypothetical protein
MNRQQQRPPALDPPIGYSSDRPQARARSAPGAASLFSAGRASPARVRNDTLRSGSSPRTMRDPRGIERRGRVVATVPLGMPKRRNLFQDVVEIIHRHMAEGAVVVSPALLPHKVTGKNREVDVVIRSAIAGHEVVVSVEATAKRRPATVEWVEQMLRKHQELSTNKLVLVSEAGFTPDARILAEQGGAVPLAPEDLAQRDPVFTIVNNLQSIWPKTLALTPERARVAVRRPDGSEVWFEAPANLWIYAEDGEHVGTLIECLMGFINQHFPKIMDDIGLADIDQDRDEHFDIKIGKLFVNVNDRVVALCARFEEGPSGVEFHPIQGVQAFGRAVVKVTRVDLLHQRLGDVAFAYGKSELGDKPALVVVTEDDASTMFTLRIDDIGEATGRAGPGS